jgi:hypothetical protein
VRDRRLQWHRKAVILWQKSDGRAATSLMNGVSVTSTGVIGLQSRRGLGCPCWQRFQCDGRSEIL